MSGSDARNERWVWTSPLVVAAVLFLSFELFGGRPLLHGDAALDLLAARDAAERGAWLGSGSAISDSDGRDLLHGLLQSTLWSNLLGAVYGLKLPPTLAWDLVLASHAAGFATLFALIRRRSGSRVAFAAMLPALLLATSEISPARLWAPAFLLLPCVLFWWGLAREIESPRIGMSLLTASAMAFATGIHLVAFVLLPLWVFATLGSATRASRGLIVALVGGALPFALMWATAPGSFRVFTARLATPTLGAVVATLGIVMLAAARLWHRWTGSAGPDVRLRRLFLLLVAAGALAYVVMSAVTKREMALRYLLPVLPGALAVATWEMQAQARRLLTNLGAAVTPARVVLLALVLVVVPSAVIAARMRPRNGRWIPCGGGFTDHDMKRLADHLYGQGMTWEDLSRRLGGPHQQLLPQALGLFDPVPPAWQPGRPGPTFAIVRTDQSRLPTPLPQDWTVLPGDEGHAIVVRPRLGWLRPAQAKSCWSPEGSDAPPGIGESAECRGVEDPDDDETYDDVYTHRGWDDSWRLSIQVREGLGVHEAGTPVRIAYRIPYDSDGGEGDRRLVELSSCAVERGWRLAARPTESPIGAAQRSLELAPGRGEVVAYLGLARWEPSLIEPPALLETAPEEAALRELAASAPPSSP
jgi:hypothetical protein